MRFVSCTTVLFALLAFPNFAQSEVVTIRLRGEVTGVVDSDASLASTAVAGDPAYLILNYDRSAPSNPNPQNTAAGFSAGINLGLTLAVSTVGGPSWSLNQANAPEIAVTLENNSINTTGVRDDSFYLTPQLLTAPVWFSFSGQLVSNVQTLPTVSQLLNSNQITARGNTEDVDTVFFSFNRLTYHGVVDGGPTVGTIGPLSFSLTGSGASRSASFNIPTTTPGAFHRLDFSDDLETWTPLVLIEGNGFPRSFFVPVGNAPRRFFRIVDNAAEFDELFPQ